MLRVRLRKARVVFTELPEDLALEAVLDDAWELGQRQLFLDALHHLLEHLLVLVLPGLGLAGFKTGAEVVNAEIERLGDLVL